MENILKDANSLLKKVREKHYDRSQEGCMNEPRDPCALYKNAKFQTNQCLNFPNQDEKKCCPRLSPINEDKPKICLFSNTALDSCFHKAYCQDLPNIENPSNCSTKPSSQSSHFNYDSRVQNSMPVPKFYPQSKQSKCTISPQCLDSKVDTQPNCSKCSINNQCFSNDSKTEMMKLKKQVELAKLDLECKQKRVEDRRLRLEKVYRDLECQN